MARPGVREPLQARSELTRNGQALDVLHCGVDAHRKRRNGVRIEFGPDDGPQPKVVRLGLRERGDAQRDQRAELEDRAASADEVADGVGKHEPLAGHQPEVLVARGIVGGGPESDCALGAL